MGGVSVREELGGSGLGRFDSTIIFEALATGCPRVAAFLSIHNTAVWMIDAFGSRGFPVALQSRSDRPEEAEIFNQGLRRVSLDAHCCLVYRSPSHLDIKLG